MTNEKRYKTAGARSKAFREFCQGRDCAECPAHNDDVNCAFIWLDLDKQPMSATTAANVLAEYNRYCRSIEDHGEPGACPSITLRQLTGAIEKAVETLHNTKRESSNRD